MCRFCLESLLQINDELNGCFTRYDRHMKNRKAATANVSGNETSFIDPVVDLPPPIVREKLILIIICCKHCTIINY